MKALWFTNFLHPSVSAALGLHEYASGSWLWALADALRARGDVDLTFVTADHRAPSSCANEGGVRQYIVHMDREWDARREPSPRHLAEYRGIVRDVAPDIVHIHGTERHYGCLTVDSRLPCPSVLTVQGIVQAQARHYFGGLSLREVVGLQTPWALLRGTAPVLQWLRYRRHARLERIMLAACTNVIGRTAFDRGYLLDTSPSARYFQLDDAVRGAFYDVVRSPETVQRCTIFAPAGYLPLKGVHWLLRAVALVRRRVPEVRLRVAMLKLAYKRPAPAYARYLGSLVSDLGLKDIVEPLWFLNAEEMARELAAAHVFACPSLTETGPMALAEALVVGVPSVASYAGGVSGLVRDGVDALCFEPGDPTMLAERICRLFSDDDLAARLAASGREVARPRHEPERIADQLVSIYGEILSGGRLA